MIFLGADPGQTGAVAIIGEGDPVVLDWQGDERAMAEQLQLHVALAGMPVLAALERQQAMPKQGVASTFKLGVNFGVWLGILAALGVPVILPRPCDWKRGYVPAKADKDASLAVARRMFPMASLARKKDHGRAEALLLADFARRTHGGAKLTP